MTTLWPVAFSNCAAISFIGPAIPPPASTWSSAAMADRDAQKIELARKTILHLFILSSLSLDTRLALSHTGRSCSASEHFVLVLVTMPRQRLAAKFQHRSPGHCRPGRGRTACGAQTGGQ